MSEFIGIILIAALFTLMGFGGWMDGSKESRALIRQCEAELPRNQHCVLQAVPEVSDD